jgi:hypothetical protein
VFRAHRPGISTGGPTSPVWYLLGVALAVGMAMVLLFGEETTGRRLEEASP